MRLATLIVLVLLGAGSIPAAAQPPISLSAVATELTLGQTLAVVDANFTATSPSTDWRWLSAPAAEGLSHIFVCYNPRTKGRLLITVEKAPSTSFDTAFMTEFLRGVNQRAHKDGFTVSNIQHAPAGVPRPESLRMSLTVSREGVDVDWVMYLATDHERVFSVQGPASVESTDLLTLARSFHLLREPAPPPHVVPWGQSVGNAFMILGGTLAFVFFTAMVNVAAARPTLLNGGRLAFFALAAGPLVRVGLAVHVSQEAGQECPRAAEAAFLVGGEGLLSMIVAFALGRRFQRMREDVEEEQRRKRVGRPVVVRPVRAPERQD